MFRKKILTPVDAEGFWSVERWLESMPDLPVRGERGVIWCMGYHGKVPTSSRAGCGSLRHCGFYPLVDRPDAHSKLPRNP